MKFQYIVTVDAKDPDVSHTMLAEYIRDAIGSWGGQFHPDHPLFSAYIGKVTCRSYIPPLKAGKNK